LESVSWQKDAVFCGFSTEHDAASFRLKNELRPLFRPGVLTDAAVGTGISAGVGIGVTTIVPVTVGGAAVTTVAGATGVGGLVVITAVAGYEVGNAIGGIEVGGQSIHDHIADGMIWCLDQLGLW
jgi:hypothetical protein